MATLDAHPDVDIVKVRGEADIEMYGVDAMPTGYENASGLAVYNRNSAGEENVTHCLTGMLLTIHQSRRSIRTHVDILFYMRLVMTV